MARSLRDLRRKMKAIKSTRQVTKAMELVSASKMRRAVNNAVTLRRYALAAWNVLQHLAAFSSVPHPFLEARPAEKILVLFFTSDRGLCGSLNAQLIRAATHYLRAQENLSGFRSAEYVAIGRKSQQFLARTGRNVVAAFPALSNNPAFRDVLPIARFAIDSFRSGTYDHVVMIYADFLSPLVQEPVVNVLLPFSQDTLRDMIDSLLPRRRGVARARVEEQENVMAQYVFEPSPEELLNTVLPQLTELQIYQAVLESAASEHSARMVAMRNATENATGILDDLTLTYNQTRQAGITAELAELSASKAALE